MATEALADRLGGGIGGLLNATFGNAAELIIGTLALAGGPHRSRQGVADRIDHRQRAARLRRRGAGRRAQPPRATFQPHGCRARHDNAAPQRDRPDRARRLSPARAAANSQRRELELDTEIAVVLFVTYCLSLVFTLRTHRDLYGRRRAGRRLAASAVRRRRRDRACSSRRRSAVAVVSELLVGTVADSRAALGMSELFIGVVVVALVGNAAEHYSAVVAGGQQPDGRGHRDRRRLVDADRALCRAGARVSQLLRSGRGPWTCCSRFSSSWRSGSLLSIAFISHDGETHWMEGVQLLAVYTILALGFYYLPAL